MTGFRPGHPGRWAHHIRILSNKSNVELNLKNTIYLLLIIVFSGCATRSSVHESICSYSIIKSSTSARITASLKRCLKEFSYNEFTSNDHYSSWTVANPTISAEYDKPFKITISISNSKECIELFGCISKVGNSDYVELKVVENGN